jgi:hypothetical protein
VRVERVGDRAANVAVLERLHLLVHEDQIEPTRPVRARRSRPNLDWSDCTEDAGMLLGDLDLAALELQDPRVVSGTRRNTTLSRYGLPFCQ